MEINIIGNLKDKEIKRIHLTSSLLGNVDKQLENQLNNLICLENSTMQTYFKDFPTPLLVESFYSSYLYKNKLLLLFLFGPLVEITIKEFIIESIVSMIDNNKNKQNKLRKNFRTFYSDDRSSKNYAIGNIKLYLSEIKKNQQKSILEAPKGDNLEGYNKAFKTKFVNNCLEYLKFNEITELQEDLEYLLKYRNAISHYGICDFMDNFQNLPNKIEYVKGNQPSIGVLYSASNKAVPIHIAEEQFSKLVLDDDKLIDDIFLRTQKVLFIFHKLFKS